MVENEVKLEKENLPSVYRALLRKRRAKVRKVRYFALGLL